MFQTFLQTFKYKFINCKQNLSLLYTLFMCPTVSDLCKQYNYDNSCLFDILLTLLFAILLTTEIFKQATSHKADWILTDCCPLYLPLLYMHVFSLMKVLEVERSVYYLVVCIVPVTFAYLYILMLVVVGLGIRWIC